jgi:hypothetical protein
MYQRASSKNIRNLKHKLIVRDKTFDSKRKELIRSLYSKKKVNISSRNIPQSKHNLPISNTTKSSRVLGELSEGVLKNKLYFNYAMMNRCHTSADKNRSQYPKFTQYGKCKVVDTFSCIGRVSRREQRNLPFNNNVNSLKSHTASAHRNRDNRLFTAQPESDRKISLSIKVPEVDWEETPLFRKMVQGQDCLYNFRTNLLTEIEIDCLLISNKYNTQKAYITLQYLYNEILNHYIPNVTSLSIFDTLMQCKGLLGVRSSLLAIFLLLIERNVRFDCNLSRVCIRMC